MYCRSPVTYRFWRRLLRLCRHPLQDRSFFERVLQIHSASLSGLTGRAVSLEKLVNPTLQVPSTYRFHQMATFWHFRERSSVILTSGNSMSGVVCPTD